MLINQTLDKLDALGLFGMALALREQLEQSQYASLSFEERFGLLVDREAEARDSRRLALRLKAAKLRQEATVEDIDFRTPRGLDRSVILNLAQAGWVAAHHNLPVTGPTGAGKTHIAQALVHQACRQGYGALCMKTTRLLADLGGGHADGTWDGRLRGYLQPHLLVLDDFGMREFSPQQAEDLYELIGECCRAGSMILTSNRSPQDSYALFPNPVLAEGALDRLLGRAHHLVLQGRSYRPLQRPDRATRPTDEPA
jgi:DNA replication protein DnaC